MDFVTDAPPIVREGPFRKEKVRYEHEVAPKRAAHGVCHDEWVSDLERRVDLRCDVDHGSEDDNSIGMLACRVENGDEKNLEENDLCPWVSSHSRWAGRVRQDGVGGESVKGSRETAEATVEVLDIRRWALILGASVECMRSVCMISRAC